MQSPNKLAINKPLWRLSRVVYKIYLSNPTPRFIRLGAQPTHETQISGPAVLGNSHYERYLPPSLAIFADTARQGLLIAAVSTRARCSVTCSGPVTYSVLHQSLDAALVRVEEPVSPRRTCVAIDVVVDRLPGTWARVSCCGANSAPNTRIEIDYTSLTSMIFSYKTGTTRFIQNVLVIVQLPSVRLAPQAHWTHAPQRLRKVGAGHPSRLNITPRGKFRYSRRSNEATPLSHYGEASPQISEP